MKHQQVNPTSEEVNSNSNTCSEAVDGAGVNAFVNALIDGEGSGLATVSVEACGLGGTTFNECTDLISLSILGDTPGGTDKGVGSTQTSPRPPPVLPIVPTITPCPYSSMSTGPTGQTLVSPPTTQKTYSSTAEFATIIIASCTGFVIAGCILKYIHTSIRAAHDDNDDLVTPFQSLRDELRARRILEPIFQLKTLVLDEETIWNLNCIDCFLSQSRGSESTITEVCLYPNAYLNSHAFSDHDDDVWDKLGQAVGNLQRLGRLTIFIRGRAIGHEDEVVPNPDWERLARLLSHVRQEVTFQLDDSEHWNVEEVQALARAIRGHPTINRLAGGESIPYEASAAFYSALATLPALGQVQLSNRRQHAQLEDEVALVHPESLTELLRVPSLWRVSFGDFSFTPALCQAAANAFMEGTAVTSLEFYECSFSTGESAGILLNGLSRNTSVTCIRVYSDVGRAFCDALAVALPLNSTLHELYLCSEHLLPVFLALGENQGIKALNVDVYSSMDESMCTAMNDGLGRNETLGLLRLLNTHLTDDNADFWRRALSFLRTTKSLKSLSVSMQRGVTESWVSAFCVNIAAMLEENTSLESFCVQEAKIKAEDYIALVTTLHHNTTLKEIFCGSYYYYLSDTTLQLTADEDKRMAALLKKNYALESISDVGRVGDVGAILRLNAAGRRYLIEDGSSISKGVEVLSAVCNDINCVFLHLLENPRLCDRSAVEIASSGESDGSSILTHFYAQLVHA